MTSPRKHPRISVNKLGEYLTAAPARRRRIIHDQKYPPTYIVARYTEAERAIIEFLLAGQDMGILESHVQRLAQTAAKTEHDEQRIENCIEAIESFANAVDQLDLDGMTLAQAEPEPPHLEIKGVAISVRPEVRLTFSGKGGQPRSGLLKIYFAKNHPLDDRSGAYVATVLRQFANVHMTKHGQGEHRRMLVVDVFAGKVFAAPQAASRRLDDVGAACEEIAVRWNSL